MLAYNRFMVVMSCFVLLQLCVCGNSLAKDPEQIYDETFQVWPERERLYYGYVEDKFEELAELGRVGTAHH